MTTRISWISGLVNPPANKRNNSFIPDQITYWPGKLPSHTSCGFLSRCLNLGNYFLWNKTGRVWYFEEFVTRILLAQVIYAWVSIYTTRVGVRHWVNIGKCQLESNTTIDDNGGLGVSILGVECGGLEIDSRLVQSSGSGLSVMGCVPRKSSSFWCL